MHDEEIRALVREAVARHLSAASEPVSGARRADITVLEGRAGAAGVAWKQHVSHGRYVFLAPADPDSPCVVEPQVRCHHCGFCQSYGH